MPDSSRIVVCRGPRAVELRLLTEIEAVLPAGRIASPPVRVVVPSSALRRHLEARLLARRPAWLGLEIRTLAATVEEILERGGAQLSTAAPIQSILVARLAARESALGRSLGGLVRGFDAVAGAVRDLLDAGFAAEHLDAVVERLDLESGTVGRATVERAGAIARVAAALRNELALLGLSPAADRIAEAGRLFAEAPDRVLPATAQLVCGFTDATGVATDLLEALVRHRPTLVLIDSPPGLDGGETTWRFGRRLLERLAGVAAIERDRDAAPRARIESFRAPDPARETRAAATWIRCASGAQHPERTGLVVREIEPVLGRLAAELDRAAVPFSAEGGLAGARQRAARGVLTLLERRGETPLGVALSLCRERLAAATGRPAAEIRLAFAQLGVRDLEGAATARLERDEMRLPLPDRLASAVAGEPERTVQRTIDAASIAAAATLFADLRARLPARPGRHPIGQRTARLRALLIAFLPATDTAVLLATLDAPALAALSPVEVDDDEWSSMLEGIWRNAASCPLGAGGGIALFSVTEARGLTFDRLALIGLSRGRFPRTVHADPLLPDALRLRLRDLLPDLPVKAEGHDEESYLFAQLLSSARELALFRPLVDDDGRAVSPSPFLAELWRASGSTETVAPVGDHAAFDRSIAAAVRSGEPGLATTLGAAIVEGRSRAARASSVAADRVAEARLAIVRQFAADPALPDADALGPYLGRVGLRDGDARRPIAPSVTALERYAGCGWRSFLEQVLRLRQPPELGESLPSLPPRLRGSVAHRVLEGLFGPSARPGPKLAEVTASDAARGTLWPPDAELERRTVAAAHRALVDEGLDPRLFATSLAREALELLEVARQIDWPSGTRDLLAVEAEGEARFVAAGADRRLPFRVDRVERIAGEIVLTDYKTGTPVTEAVTPGKRSEHLAKAVAKGTALQLPVYLAGLEGAAARARYLYLKPGLDRRAQELWLATDELDRSALTTVLDTLYGAWDGHWFVPRLLHADLQTTYADCAYCEVREACLQGDSGARLRLARWVNSARTPDATERAARDWWSLAGAGSRRGDEGA